MVKGLIIIGQKKTEIAAILVLQTSHLISKSCKIFISKLKTKYYQSSGFLKRFQNDAKVSHFFLLNFTKMNVPNGGFLQYKITWGLHGGFLQNSHWRVTGYDGNFHSLLCMKNLTKLTFSRNKFFIDSPTLFTSTTGSQKQSSIRIQQHQIFKYFRLLSLLILQPSSFKFHVLILNFSRKQNEKWNVNK